MDDFGFDDAMMMGAGYAAYRHGQDQQTAALVAALDQITNNDYTSMPPPTGQPIIIADDELVDRRGMPIQNAAEHTTLHIPDSWEDFIGQDKLKRQLLVHIAYAQDTHTPLPHVLLASGNPGVGKTTIARMIAQAIDAELIELVPPFNIYTLVEAAEELTDGDVLFIDEVHRLAQNGKKGAEILLKVMEDHVAFLPNGEIVELPRLTVVGATTDKDLLPETIVDRFKIKPYFEVYTLTDMQIISCMMGARHGCQDMMIDQDFLLTGYIAQASRRTPRISEELVLAARALTAAYGGMYPTPGQLYDFVDVQYDGLTRAHVHYLTTLFERFGKPMGRNGVEYLAGEATMQAALRETKQGLGRLERDLIEAGLLDLTPRGRLLTDAGRDRAAGLSLDPTPSRFLEERHR